MNLVTVSLNPALDQTVCVDHFRVDAVNRGQSMRFEAGGKGVNVALFVAEYFRQRGLPATITVTGLLGRENASIFEDLFTLKSIHDRFIRIPGRTRVGVKIVDEANQQTTDINMPGLSPSPEAEELVYNTVRGLAESHDWFVLTGSLPPGVSTDAYAALIRLITAAGGRVILDSSGPALREGLRAVPAVVKPNITELQELTGRRLDSFDAVRDAARQLLTDGIQMVIVSMGSQGAGFFTPWQSARAIVPQVTVKTTVGAGDAMVAGALAALDQSLDLPDLARLSTAFSVGVITQSKRGLPEPDELDQIASQIRVETVD